MPSTTMTRPAHIEASMTFMIAAFSPGDEPMRVRPSACAREANESVLHDQPAPIRMDRDVNVAIDRRNASAFQTNC